MTEVFILKDVEKFNDELFNKTKTALPKWRRAQIEERAEDGDKKRMALAYFLLKFALKKVFGVEDVKEPKLNEYKKPYFEDSQIHFNVSHSKDAVAVAVSDGEVGVDVESFSRYNEDKAYLTCTKREIEKINKAKTPSVEFIKIWTKKEAVGKYLGRGVDRKLLFSEYRKEFLTYTRIYKSCALTVCYGKKNEKVLSPTIATVSIKDLLKFE